MTLYYVASGWSAVRVVGFVGEPSVLDREMANLGFVRVGRVRYNLAVFGNRMLKWCGCARVSKTVTYDECVRGFNLPK